MCTLVSDESSYSDEQKTYCAVAVVSPTILILIVQDTGRQGGDVREIILKLTVFVLFNYLLMLKIE